MIYFDYMLINDCGAIHSAIFVLLNFLKFRKDGLKGQKASSPGQRPG